MANTIIVFRFLLIFLTNIYSQRKSREVNYKLQTVKFELDLKDNKINNITKKYRNRLKNNQ